VRIFLLHFGFSCIGVFPFLADDAEDASASSSARQQIMVVTAAADLKVGDDRLGSVPPGSVLTFTQRDGAWLYIPTKRGWIKEDGVIPIEKSEAHFTNVIANLPTAVAYHHRGIARHALGYHELAMRDLDEAVKLGLKDPALLVNRAIVWHSLGNDQNALSEIDKAIQAEPENALARNNRALIRASLGDLQGALEDASEAIRLDPDYAEGFNNRGVTRVKLGDFAPAIEDYTEAIRLDSSFVEAFANRGYAAKRLGKFDDALQDYARAVELAPQSPQAFNDAAWLVATCPQEQIRDGKRAVQYATHACELTSYKNGEFIDTLAAAYAADGQYPHAVKAQQQALTLLPQAVQADARERLKLYQSGQPFIEGR
jgi:tetratricopeptide (TPR) repeat protein